MAYFSGNKVGNLRTTSIITSGDNGINYQDTFWDDLRVPLDAIKLGGVKDPNYLLFKDNGSGSTGTFAYWFDASAEEEMFFTVQLPHNYKLETDLHPHVHWVPKTDGSAGQVVNWGLEYTIANHGEVFGLSNIISGNAHHPVVDPVVAYTHYLTEVGTISGASIDSISTMIVCRVFRDATGALGTDDYADDAALLEIDLHYEIDYPGSRSEYIK